MAEQTTPVDPEVLEDDDDEIETEDETGTVSFKGVVKKAFGEVLGKMVDGKFVATPVAFEAKYKPIKLYKDIPEDEMPNKKDILKSVNVTRKLNARAKYSAEALKDAGFAKPDPNDPKVVLANMLKSIDKLEGMDEASKETMKAILLAQSAKS
jgi:hypothetical protein